MTKTDRWDIIDECIDMRDMLSELKSSDRSILLMTLRGYSQKDTAKLKGVCRSGISKRVNKAYKQIREKRGGDYFG